MTYPLTALIEITWEEVKAREESLGELDPGIVEVISCVERALNFMHTGNPAVIKTSIMNSLWIGRSIINDGVPSFHPGVVRVHCKDLVKVGHGEWPYDLVHDLPKSAGESALRYRYGEVAVGVS